MQVRRIQPGDDMARAGHLLRQAYGRLDPDSDHDAYHDVIADVSSRADDSHVIVAVDDDDGIVGCLTFVTGTGDPDYEFDDPDAASFRYFGVDPACQGQGVGEAMVRWVIDEARRIGRRRIRMHTLESMRAAQRLYERLGFARDPATDADWDGVIGLAYLLDLG
ncbi:MAG: GNAT family N-acetyltransferase [Ilumatobacteraceae bacterium]